MKDEASLTEVQRGDKKSSSKSIVGQSVIRSSVIDYSIIALPVLLIAVFLYAPTIAHPAMYDTLLHTQLAEDLTWASVWMPNERFGFYRPLVFLPFVLMEQAGRYQPWLLHLLNIGQHAINVALLYSLVKRVWPGRWQLTALVSASLFATFPFAYQALAIYGNNAYLTVTGIILLGLRVTVSSGRLTGDQTINRRSAIQSLDYSIIGYRLPLIFLLGVLVHETAILLLPLALILSAILYVSWGARVSASPQQLIRSYLLRHAGLIFIALAYLAIYFVLPRGGGPTLDYGGNLLWPKLLLFMQTVAHPAVFFLNQMIGGPSAIWLGFGLMLLWMLMLVGFHLWVIGKAIPNLVQVLAGASLTTPILFGLAWAVLSLALIGLTLPTYYIEDGARLLYPAGVGIALIWGGLFTPSRSRLDKIADQLSRITNRSSLIAHRPAPIARPLTSPHRLIPLILLIATLISSSWFTRRMVGLYDMLAGSAWGLEREAIISEHDAVIINFPQWLSWPDKVFPVGTEFAPILGDHLFMSEFLRVNFGTAPNIVNLHVPELLANTPYAYGLYGVNAVADLVLTADEVNMQNVFLQTYAPDGPQTGFRGSALADLWDDETLLSFGGDQPLDNLHRSICFNEPERFVQSGLGFRAESGLPPTAVLFVQVLDPNGALIGQLDGPLMSIPPARVSFASPDESDIGMLDYREIRIEDGGEPDRLVFGVYDFMTGERLPAINPDGDRLPEDAFIAEINACRDGEE